MLSGIRKMRHMLLRNVGYGMPMGMFNSPAGQAGRRGELVLVLQLQLGV